MAKSRRKISVEERLEVVQYCIDHDLDYIGTAAKYELTTDVTEFRIPMDDRKLYLSAILDLYDRSIVSYVLSFRNDNLLVFNTFDKAVEKYPDAHPLYHSDRSWCVCRNCFHCASL